MTAINVTCDAAAEGWSCRVLVTESDGRSEHLVAVSRADLARLAPGAPRPDGLVRRSFEFLLEREPRSSILRSFDLPAIGRYFPEFESSIGG